MAESDSTVRKIAEGLDAIERGLIRDGRGGHLMFVKTPGLVESTWSPFGGCHRYSLTPLGRQVAEALGADGPADA